MEISNQLTENVDKAVKERAMAGVLNLRNIFQLVNHILNDGAFP
jgi:hypothetical protein